MKKNYNQLMRLLSACMFILVFASFTQAQTKFKIGDRVEGDATESKSNYIKGVIIPFKNNDIFNGYKPSSGYFYRVRFDGYDAEGTLVRAEDLRVPQTTVTTRSATNNPGTLQQKPTTPTQQTNPKGSFKVGDRVEEFVGGNWYPATITRGLEHNSYLLVRDQFVGMGLRDDIATPEYVRAARTASKAPVAKKMPPMRRPARCPEQQPAKSGPPPLALVKQLIQCSWEEISTPRSIINFDLHTVEIGTPRKWETRWDGGDLGKGVPGETIVYPIQGTWTKKTFAVDGSSVVITEEKGTHKCYIDPFHKWKCGYENSVETQPRQEIYK